jgi:hypothetical protein
MDMQPWKKILIVTILIAAAAGFGRYTAPSKVVEKEHIVYQDKIVEKIVNVKDTSHKDNKVIERLTSIKPDGTKTIATKIYDKSDVEITQKNTVNKTEDVTQDTEKSKTVDYKKDDLILSAGYKLTIPSGDPAWGLLFNKRLIGPIYIGGFGFTDKTIGASVGVSF